MRLPMVLSALTGIRILERLSAMGGNIVQCKILSY